jgi:hypothetical protein
MCSSQSRHLPASLIRGATPVLEDRRKWPRLNELIKVSQDGKDNVKLSAFRWASRKLSPDQRDALERRVEAKEDGGQMPQALEQFPNICRLFSECGQQQRLIILAAVMHLSAELPELEANLKRNWDILSRAQKETH